MRYPQEKAPAPPDDLPNPELNPLLNPTLGRNLGRWAEVYFTSPPEKREEAVGELLRELKENPAVTETEFAHGDLPAGLAAATLDQGRPFEETSEVFITATSGVQCAECGHHHPAAQRFCGMCGAPLANDALEDYVTVARREPEPVFAQTSIFGFNAPATVTEPPLSNGADIAWLREKNFAGEAAGTSSGARKFIPALLAMAAIGILIYAQSLPPKTQPRPTVAGTAAPRVENAPQARPSPETPPPAPANSSAPAPAPSTPAPAPPSPAANANTVAENSAPAVPAPKQTIPEKPAAPAPGPGRAPQSNPASTPTPKTLPAALNASAGAEDLALATDYLNGRRGPRDSAEAAKFLWKAVGKENPSAILLLSDMYLIGDGVPKSCDQARLLLNAAVRKNVPQAAQKLRNLQTAGCP